MLPQAIHFRLSAAERDVKVLLPHQLLAVRQTSSSLEFLWTKRKGSTAVVFVEGMNLGILLREILIGTKNHVSIGPHGPAWARCQVFRIYHRLGWTRPTTNLALNPNPASRDYIELEAKGTRDIWGRNGLDAFAVPRGPAEKFLLQFQDNHAYTLTALPGTFTAILQELLNGNFTPRMTNRFSIFPNSPYSACVPDVPRFNFDSILHEQRDLAARGEWDVIMDFRGDKSRTPEISLT